MTVKCLGCQMMSSCLLLQFYKILRERLSETSLLQSNAGPADGSSLGPIPMYHVEPPESCIRYEESAVGEAWGEVGSVGTCEYRSWDIMLRFYKMLADKISHRTLIKLASIMTYSAPPLDKFSLTPFLAQLATQQISIPDDRAVAGTNGMAMAREEVSCSTEGTSNTKENFQGGIATLPPAPSASSDTGIFVTISNLEQLGA
eukprot:g46997.t1